MKTSQVHTYKKNDKIRHHQKILLNLIKKNFNEKKNGKLLDIGCANGTFLKNFHKKFRRFVSTGVDTSKNMILLANKKKIKNSNFLNKDFMKLNIKNKFDIVVASGVLAFYDDFSKPLNKMISFLKSKSYLFIFGTFNSNNIDTLIKFRNNYTKSKWEKGLNSFSVETISNFLNKKKIDYKFQKFYIPFNLGKKKNPIISYTLNTLKNGKIILNGANIKMELFFLIIKKK